MIKKLKVNENVGNTTLEKLEELCNAFGYTTDLEECIIVGRDGVTKYVDVPIRKLPGNKYSSNIYFPNRLRDKVLGKKLVLTINTPTFGELSLEDYELFRDACDYAYRLAKYLSDFDYSGLPEVPFDEFFD